eukprot:2797181-Prorocentrum_lima.AAC.1
MDKSDRFRCEIQREALLQYLQQRQRNGDVIGVMHNHHGLHWWRSREVYYDTPLEQGFIAIPEGHHSV